MPVPQEILDRVELFERNREAYKSTGYNETQLRREFVDPFFKALGWDVDNEQGHAEAYKDVVHEDRVKVGGRTKAPDYAFRIGGTRKFFVETKAPSKDLKQDPEPAYQVRRYAWNAKLPLSILTDFEEFAVYDCRVRPKLGDRASVARTIYVRFDEYAERWDEIAELFSRDAILKGAFDAYVVSQKKKRGTMEVDDAFLLEIDGWREALARNLAIRNDGLGVRELNFAVQRTIDRIIFLRICEDRGIEQYERLRALLNGGRLYARLGELFQDADERYNSGLFHFRKERGREAPPDELTLGLTIDDKVLKDIIRGLYYPESPYEFAEIPPEILGQVYERFLGKVIRLTAGHRAKVEDKPEVRKAGGVYYTPSYIVDYIVENTVGKLLEDSTPAKVEKLRIVDPACGSGSFLLGAYRKLLGWHRDYYVEKGPGRYSKGKIPKVYERRSGDWRLTTVEKKRILLNTIYGVDIDPQAVEVTKLSLLLKVLEGESGETLQTNLRLFRERALPDLGDNIKCGNSLIGPDYYDDKQMDLLDEEQRYRINVFDWEAEFPKIFERKNAGFDVVIGNPPYVRQEMLSSLKDYFREKFVVFHSAADLYSYFIERGVHLLRKEGVFSYIVANKWMRAAYGEPLRNFVKQRCLEEIVDFGDLRVFQAATTYPCIVRIRNRPPLDTLHAVRVESLTFRSLRDYAIDRRFLVKLSGLREGSWTLVGESTGRLLRKIRAAGEPLCDYVNDKIYYGIKTGLNDAFVITGAERSNLVREHANSSDLLRPFLAGRDVRRFETPRSDRFLVAIPNGWTNKNIGNAGDAWGWFRNKYPAVARHLAPFAERAKARSDQGEYWWELRACDYYDRFKRPKIVIPTIVKRASYSLDKSGFFQTTRRPFLLPMTSTCLAF